MPACLRTICFFFMLPLLLGAGYAADHPFHVGVIEIEHNAGEKSLELSCKLFTDDFERALSNRFKTAVDLTSPARHAAMDSLVARYLQENLSFTMGGQRMTGKYLGFEQDKEAVYVYWEYGSVTAFTSLQATCSLLYETFGDQINIFHVTVRGERKSSKLNNPDRQIEFKF